MDLRFQEALVDQQLPAGESQQDQHGSGDQEGAPGHTPAQGGIGVGSELHESRDDLQRADREDQDRDQRPVTTHPAVELPQLRDQAGLSLEP